MTNRRLIEFLKELGAAMSSAGDATTFITRELERIGPAYGLKDLRVSAGPTLLILRYAEEDIAIVDLTTSSPVDLRLDQVSDIYRLLEDAEAGRVEPQLGIERLHETLKRKSRFSAPVRVAGLGLISASVESGGISMLREAHSLGCFSSWVPRRGLVTASARDQLRPCV